MHQKRSMASCIQVFQKDTVLSPLFVALEVLFEVLIPMVMAKLIDLGVNAGDLNYIWKTGLLLIGMALISLAFGTLSGRYAARASAGFARNLRREMYHNVQDFSFSNIDKYSTGGIVTRLTTDVTNVQNAFQMIIRVAVRCPLMLVFALIMTFRISGTLGLIFLCIIPVLAVGLYIIIRFAHPVFERVFQIYDKLNNVVQENLLGIRVVKSFVQEEKEKDKFGAVSSSIYNDFTKAEKTVAFNMPLMQFCVYGCMLLISWFGARMVVGGSLSTGELTSLFSYTMQILMSLMLLSMVLVMITMARASGERITEILNQESDLKSGNLPAAEIADGSVVFQQVSFSYAGKGGKLCLKDVDLEIRSGETVGILGGTGTSKTTLVQLIARLYDATEGVVKVGGVDVRDYDLASLRNQVAMVLQKNTLFSGTIKENLRWGCPAADDDALVRVCKLAQADGFIQELQDGYDTHVEQGGTNVSGGQKQRLCIARALLKKPKILILDDSTSAVDTKTDAMIRRAFREEIPDTTKIIIAQRISSIEDADKIVIMDGGTIAAVGTHETLLETSEIYREVYASQMKGGDKDVQSA